MALLRQFDVTRRGDGGQQQGDAPYFTAGMLGYAAGLLATFAANTISGAGQPALVYIVP